jgi:hypothetical protein
MEAQYQELELLEELMNPKAGRQIQSFQWNLLLHEGLNAEHRASPRMRALK